MKRLGVDVRTRRPTNVLFYSLTIESPKEERQELVSHKTAGVKPTVISQDERFYIAPKQTEQISCST